MSDKDINFRDRNLLFVDIETTGLDVDNHEIVEIGCLLVDGKTLDIKSEYYSKVKPEHIDTANREGLQVSGYTKEAWMDAKQLKVVLGEVAKLAAGAMFVGWNVMFDRSFLEKAYKKKNIKHLFDYHSIDLISLAYSQLRLKDKPEGLGLRKVATHFGIEIPEQHGAMVDIQATYDIFKILMKGR